MRLMVLLLVWATTAQAQGPFAVRIESSESPGTCTAAVLAPDLIVTAAHCLQPGREIYSLRPPDGPPRAITTIFRHPVYGLAPAGPARFRFDIALGTLDGPLHAAPLPVGPPPVPGERLAIETWRRDTAVPQHRGCTALAAPEGQVLLDCAVAMGHSGAPVLRFTGDGPEIVAIVTARTSVKGHPAALGLTLSGRMEVLMHAAGRD